MQNQKEKKPSEIKLKNRWNKTNTGYWLRELFEKVCIDLLFHGLNRVL